MYTSFFGLNDKPFAITPDPRYLFMSERHGEGLAHLVYGVTESGGFIQLTGEVGTGKTTLVRTLLMQLPQQVDVALILNPQLDAREFLLAICEELGVELPTGPNGSKGPVDALNRHLLAAHARGRRTILLVDEAQNLSGEVLEQLRLLTNLETARQKLLQIILIGQPELRDVLAQNKLRQLAQRVTGRYHLEPLSRAETAHYIEHRLKVAGALQEIFEPAAKRAVYRYSGGIPRLINVICDRALLGAYSNESRRVTRRIAERAAAEVSGEAASPLLRWLLPGAGIGAAILIAAGVWVAIEPAADDELPTVSLPLVAAGDSAAAIAAEPAAAAAPEAPEAPQAPPPRLDRDLRSALYDTTFDDAMRVLLTTWEVEFDAGAGTGCGQAQAAGLDCVVQRGSWNVVRRLNRPAVLTLTDSNGDEHHAVLTAIDGDRAELAFGEQRREVGVDEIRELWFGEYVLLWRPPNGSVSSLRPGSRNENVRWLRESLARLRGADALTPEEDADYFDAELEARVRRFQKQHRLQVDGLAGQQTQIVINSLLAEDNTPLLSELGRDGLTRRD